MFRGPRQSRKVKIIKISGGRGGRGGWGGVNGGGGGLGEGPRVKIVAPRTVTNINKNYSTASAVPSGFRMIPLGDIDLQREIQLDMVSGVVNRRKLHSAKLLGAREKSDITVAVYQGAGAKQQWRRDIARYMAVRHPNILQLYGTAAYGNIHVAVFHDDLIPYREFLNLYWHLHFSRAYIYLYMACACYFQFPIPH
ncbi:hypothetical protein C8R45DRAFT_1026643 [Mycena sanguinolenta]|nr:hypothetical protein C8R45DRAFT_1026643 [Mycena sanguinolenta]